MYFSATNMPFKKNSIHAFVMIDVLHHIDDVEKFFMEANRCLTVYGQVIMIEPSRTLFGRFIYRHFHHEPYKPNATWNFSSTGPLSSANLALPWIVFMRDKRKFQRKFPHLKIKRIYAFGPLLYLLSGGFTLPQLLPNFLYPAVKFFEFILSPFHKYLGLFYIIELEKTQ
jgi:SAM-dependent methyltransferase